MAGTSSLEADEPPRDRRPHPAVPRLTASGRQVDRPKTEGRKRLYLKVFSLIPYSLRKETVMGRRGCKCTRTCTATLVGLITLLAWGAFAGERVVWARLQATPDPSRSLRRCSAARRY